MGYLNIPTEIWINIINYLEIFDILALESTSTFFRKILFKNKEIKKNNYLLKDIIGIDDEERLNRILFEMQKKQITYYLWIYEDGYSYIVKFKSLLDAIYNFLNIEHMDSDISYYFENEDENEDDYFIEEIVNNPYCRKCKLRVDSREFKNICQSFLCHYLVLRKFYSDCYFYGVDFSESTDPNWVTTFEKIIYSDNIDNERNDIDFSEIINDLGYNIKEIEKMIMIFSYYSIGNGNNYWSVCIGE